MIYYKSEAIYQQEYEKRFRGYGTYQTGLKIRPMVQQMPTVAVQPYFDKLLINGLQSTNEIEGVRSTNMELTQVLLD